MMQRPHPDIAFAVLRKAENGLLAHTQGILLHKVKLVKRFCGWIELKKTKTPGSEPELGGVTVTVGPAVRQRTDPSVLIVGIGKYNYPEVIGHNDVARLKVNCVVDDLPGGDIAVVSDKISGQHLTGESRVVAPNFDQRGFTVQEQMGFA